MTTALFPNRRNGPALRLLCCGLCALTLAQPAEAVSPPDPAGLSEPISRVVPTPVASWDEFQIRASLRVIVNHQPSQTPHCSNAPLHQRSAVLNPEATAVTIIEAGAQPRLLSLRDGLLPEVHYLPDGRYALLATRSGWVLRIDLEQARLVAEVRAGLALRGMALSAGRSDPPGLLAVANAEPHTLTVLDEQLKLIKLLRVADKTGHTTSPVAQIRTAKARSSFIATFTDMPELWEVSYNPKAPEIAVGLVHDFQYREGTFMPGYLNPQRSILPSPATNFLLTEAGNDVVTPHAGSDLLHARAGARLQVTNLDVRRKVAEFALPGWPAGGCSLAWSIDGQDRLAEAGEKPVHSNPFTPVAACVP